MEITRGSLDSISRPASSEHKSSRVSGFSLPHSDRMSSAAPFALVVLSNDATDQMQNNLEEASIDTSATCAGEDPYHADPTPENKDDRKLQLAIEEMQRLDEILSEKVIREEEIRRQTKELRAKLWHELLQNKPEGHSESASEASNTRLFLALEAPIDAEEDDFVPVFETQVPDSECDGDSRHSAPSENRPGSLIESFEVGYDSGEDHFPGSDSGSSKRKNKQKDFVRRNIERARGEGGRALLTRAERERLAELLREIDEEEEDSARGADGEGATWAASVLSGHGYTPEPADLDQLNDIDSKISLLLPAEEFHLVRSSYIDLSTCQGAGSGVGWESGGGGGGGGGDGEDPWPGEKVLQDRKERRGQERRLHQIQQQLELLGPSQEMTDESADLTERQLLHLLDECELTDSWSRGLTMTDAAP